MPNEEKKPTFDETEPVEVPTFEDTEPIAPVKKKDQTLESSESPLPSGDTNLQGASTLETPDQKTERLSYGLDGAQPKIVQPEVDIAPLKNIDPVMLMDHINTNIQGSIATKREAQALFDQKQSELEQLKSQADQLAQQYEGADDAGKLDIEAQIKAIQDKLPEFDLAINQATEEINKQNKIISYQSNVKDAIEKGKQKTDNQSYIGELVESVEAGSAQLGAGLAKTPGFIFDIFSVPQNLVAQYTGLPIGTSAAQAAEQLGLPENKVAEYYDKIIEDHQEKIKEKYDKGITEYFKNGEIAKGFELLGNQVAESAPISISLMVGNIAGASPVASTLAGGAVFGAQKKSELDENSELSEPQKVSNALSTGLFEGMFEQFGITKLGGIAKGVLETEGKKIAKEVAEKSFKQVYLPVAKKYLGVAAEETIGEAATQFAQNVVDKYSGYKPDLKLTEGVTDAAIAGLGSSFIFSAPIAAKEVVDTKRGIENIPPKPNIVQELLTTEGDRIDTQNEAVFEKVMEFKENPISEEQFQERLKAEEELGQVSPEEVDQLNSVIGAIKALDEKIPSDIVDPQTRLAVLNLLAERSEIEKSIEDKDKALTVPQQDRIKLINEQLGALSQGVTVDEALSINLKEEENAAKKGKIEQSSEPEYKGTSGQQQGEQENRPDQEKPISETKTEAGDSDKSEGIGKVEKEVKESAPANPATKKHKLAERVEESTLSPEIKKGLKEKGTSYISKSLEMSQSEANEITKNFEAAGELDNLEDFVLSPTSKIKPDVRNAVIAGLIDRYSVLSTKELDPQKKEEYTQKTVDILYESQKINTEEGRGINSIKLINRAIGKNPEFAVAGVQKDLDNRNASELKKYTNTINDAQKLLRQLLETDEGKAIIEEKVKEAIKKGKKNIFTRTAQERKDKIAELRERLKNVPKSSASSSIVGLTSEQIEIYVELGAEYLASGIVNLAKWTQKMVGEGLTEEQAKALWDQGKIEGEKFPEYAEKSRAETNKKRAERLKAQLSNLDALIKNPDRAITELESKKKILEGRDAPSQDIQNIEQEIKERKKLVQLVEKMEALDDKKKKQILGESIESIIKNGYLSDIAFKNIFAKAIGLDYLTEQDTKNIKDFATTIKEAQVLGEKFLSDPSKENQSAYKSALYKARQANGKLSEYFKKPKTLFGLLSTFIQGNLLTPLSQVTNIYANANMIPVRLAKKAVASATDWALSQGAKLKNGAKYERTHDLIANMKGSWPGAFVGLREGLKQLKTGALPEDIENRDLSTSLHPVTSLKRFYDGLTGKEKKEFSKHLNDITEGTLGIAPEIMFRLLNLGDKPFRRAAQAGALREQAAIRNLEGEELTKFLEMPPEEVADLVEQLGQEATFQDSNFVSEWLRSKSPKNKLVGDIIKFLTVSQAPYVKTPVNIALETFQYAVPVIPLAKAIYYAKEGNKRLALDNWGKAVTGFAILYVVNLLLKNGVLSGADEEDKKKRNAQYLYDKPNMINLTALNRLLNGRSPKGQNGDHKIDIKKLGIVGSVMSAAQNVQQSKEGQELNQSMIESMSLMIPATLKSSFDQSFLAGTNTLLNAMQGGDDYALRKWLISTSQTFGAAVLPNTIATLAKIDDEFFRDTRDVDIDQNIINVYKNKLFKGGELPALVNMWGEPIKNTPKDRNSWIYYLLDVTKGEKVDRNQFGIQIYDFYKETGNPEALPSPVSRTIKIGKEAKKLTPDQYELMSKYIGQSRKAEVQALLESDEWATGDEDSKIKELKKAYSEGRKNGIELFKQSSGIEFNLQEE